METQRKLLQSYAESLRLTHLRKNVESTIHQAQIDKPTYAEYTLELLGQEVKHRRETDYQRRLKMAGLHTTHDLDHYDFNFSNGVSKPELKQLRELLWLEQSRMYGSIYGTISNRQNIYGFRIDF